MRFWIDLANSPHVPFFAPIRARLLERGHEVLLTARDFAQTVPLARTRGWTFETIGAHGGRGVLAKGRSIASRALALGRFAAAERPDVAVGHNSYAQSLAARMRGVPSVTLMDYEHTPANHVSFRLADRVLVPSLVDPRILARYGATRRKLHRYEGIKELVYLSEFTRDPAFAQSEAGRRIDPGRILVLVRPPADFALYHRFENTAYEPVVRRLAGEPGVQLFLMPRTPAQRRAIDALGLDGVFVVPEATDGPNLVAAADLVLSAGGTMNREAAVLGTPAWSLFAGELGAIDRWLAEQGRLTILRGAEDLDHLTLEKKTRALPPMSSPWLIEEIVVMIEELGRSGGSSRGSGPPSEARA